MSKLKKIGFLLAFLVPILWCLGVWFGGFWHYLTPVFVFVFIPTLDYFIGADSQNVSEEVFESLNKDKYFRNLTLLWVLVQLGTLLYAFYLVAISAIAPIYLPGFVLGLALVTGGIGITVGHELGHKSSKLERFAAQVLYMMVCYMHFHIEHNRGHHVRVATLEDPATSRKRETFYQFWFRSVVGGWQSAWELEKARLQKANLKLWSRTNMMLWYSILPLLFIGSITLVFSLWFGEFVWQIPALFFVQSILAFTLLEQVNYIEHYGILRRKKENGRYERVNPLHSWNANHLISNLFLFHLQRHSDHHTYASKRYQVLAHHDESPQLPSGYPAMILLCLVPSWWFRKMDPLLEQWEKTREEYKMT
ncbi:alkane 1-monooxygenase [Peijinzhouia sedimentorum]